MTGRALTRRQAIVLRELSHATDKTPRELGVRSDVLWRLSERGFVGRTAQDAYYIKPAGLAALDEYTARQAARLIRQPRDGAR